MTTFHIVAFTKVLAVSGGVIFIIDLEDSSSKCEELVPLESASFGGLTAENRPLLCNQDCWIYDNGIWTLGDSYRPGLGGAASQSPFDGQLWISGGTNQGLKLYKADLLILTLGVKIFV